MMCLDMHRLLLVKIRNPLTRQKVQDLLEVSFVFANFIHTDSEFHVVPGANLQIFPPNTNNGQGYQTIGGPSGNAGK